MTEQATLTLTALEVPNLSRLVAPKLSRLVAPGPARPRAAEGPAGGVAALVTKTGDLTVKFCDLIDKSGTLEESFRKLATRVGGIGGAGGAAARPPKPLEGFGDSNRKGFFNAVTELLAFREEFKLLADGFGLNQEQITVLRDDIEGKAKEFGLSPAELLSAFREAAEISNEPLNVQELLDAMAVTIAATRAGGTETGRLAGTLQREEIEGETVKGDDVLSFVADLQAQRQAGGDLEVREIVGPLGRLRQDFAAILGEGVEPLRDAAAVLQTLSENGRDPAQAEAAFRDVIGVLQDGDFRGRLKAEGIDLGTPGEPLDFARILDEILRKEQKKGGFVDSLGSKELSAALAPALNNQRATVDARMQLRDLRRARGTGEELRDTAKDNAATPRAVLERGLTNLLDALAPVGDLAVLAVEGFNGLPPILKTVGATGAAGFGLFKLGQALLGGGVRKVWITNPRDYFTGFGDGGFADGEGGGRRRRGGKRKTRNQRRIGGRRRGVAGRLFDFGRRGVSRLRDFASPRAGGGLKRVLDIGRGAAGRVTNAVRTTAGGGFSRLFDFAKRGAGAARRGLAGGLAALTGTTPGAAASLPATGGAGRLLGSVAKGGKALLKRVPFLGTLVAATTGISALTDDSLDATQKGEGVGSSAGAIIGGTLGLIAGPVGAIAGSFIGEKLGGALGALAGGLFEDDQPPVPAAAQDRETAAVTAAGLAGGAAGKATPPTGKLELVVTFDRSLEARVKGVIEQGDDDLLNWVDAGPIMIDSY